MAKITTKQRAARKRNIAIARNSKKKGEGKISWKRVKSLHKGRGSTTFDTFEAGNMSLQQVASGFKSSKSGKPKNVWKIFHKKKGRYISGEIRNLKRAKAVAAFKLSKGG